MPTANILDIPNVRFLGQFRGRDGQPGLALPLFWAASGAELCFTGESLCLLLEADYDASEPWVSVELNGAQLIRTPLTRGRNEIWVFRGMTAGVPKRVRLLWETQPMLEDLRQRVEVTAVRWEEGEFLPLPAFDCRLEFVGDSITSGEGVVGAREETDWVPALFSASGTWARQAADLLNADFRMVSQSGWGVCADWSGDPRHALPAWYEETASLRPGEPDAVVINLGTNDAAAIQAGLISREQFEEAVLRFLGLLRGSHPRAKLVWAYGMLGEALRPQLERIVERFGDAYYLPLPVMTEETAGSRQHPGPLCHRAAAQAAAHFLRTLLL